MSFLAQAWGTGKEWLNSKLVRQYTANTVWMMANRAAWILSAFTIGIYVARKLGPYQFGVLNYAMALTGMFSIIATMSVEEFVVRQLVREPETSNRSLGNFFMLRVLLCVLMALLLALTLLCINVTAEVRWLCIILLLGYFSLMAQGASLHFQATVESKYIAIPQLVGCLVNSVVRGVAAWFDWPLAVFAFAESMNLLLAQGGCLLYYQLKVGSVFAWTWKWREMAALLKIALPLAICGVIGTLYARTDQLMIEYFLGPKAVGYYSLATRFTENWAICIGILCNAFFPAVITASQISLDAYRKQLHRLYFLVFWCMAGAAGMTVLLGRPVIYWLFGEAYLPSVPVLYVFVWTLLGNALLTVFCQWAINEKKLYLIAWSFASGAILNAVLNPFLIKMIGINGAALSSLISMPLGLAMILMLSMEGRSHLSLMSKSILTLPSLKLGEHKEKGS